jgi:hypothetical protein
MGAKEKILSVTASDCRWDYYRGSGSGGQKRNKTSNCVRCTHEPSGAVGKSEDGRSQSQNRRTAFKRMADTNEFQDWLRIESARRMGMLASVDDKVESSMKEKNIRVEVTENGKWVECKEVQYGQR